VQCPRAYRAVPSSMCSRTVCSQTIVGRSSFPTRVRACCSSGARGGNLVGLRPATDRSARKDPLQGTYSTCDRVHDGRHDEALRAPDREERRSRIPEARTDLEDPAAEGGARRRPTSPPVERPRRRAIRARRDVPDVCPGILRFRASSGAERSSPVARERRSFTRSFFPSSYVRAVVEKIVKSGRFRYPRRCDLSR
jgi:hypothetical protein